MRNSGASVTFHILDEASYKQANAQAVDLSNSQSIPVANGVEKQAPKAKLCYLVRPSSSSSYGFSIRSVNGKLRTFFKSHTHTKYDRKITYFYTSVDGTRENLKHLNLNHWIVLVQL